MELPMETNPGKFSNGYSMGNVGEQLAKVTKFIFQWKFHWKIFHLRQQFPTELQTEYANSVGKTIRKKPTLKNF